MKLELANSCTKDARCASFLRRLRTSKTKGAGSRVVSLAMAFKLVESAQNRWRKLNGSTLPPELTPGVISKDGVELAA